MGSVVCELLPASCPALKTRLTTDPLDMHFEVILWKLGGFLQVCILQQPVFTSWCQWGERGQHTHITVRRNPRYLKEEHLKHGGMSRKGRPIKYTSHSHYIWSLSVYGRDNGRCHPRCHLMRRRENERRLFPLRAGNGK